MRTTSNVVAIPAECHQHPFTGGPAIQHYTNGSAPLHRFSIAQQAAGFGSGVVEFNRCGRCVGALMGQSYNTLRERLRDTYREADAKAGEQRVELEVTECWAPWLAWLLAGGWVNRLRLPWMRRVEGIVLWDWLSVLSIEAVLFRLPGKS